MASLTPLGAVSRSPTIRPPEGKGLLERRPPQRRLRYLCQSPNCLATSSLDGGLTPFVGKAKFSATPESAQRYACWLLAVSAHESHPRVGCAESGSQHPAVSARPPDSDDVPQLGQRNADHPWPAGSLATQTPDACSTSSSSEYPRARRQPRPRPSVE